MLFLDWATLEIYLPNFQRSMIDYISMGRPCLNSSKPLQFSHIHVIKNMQSIHLLESMVLTFLSQVNESCARLTGWVYGQNQRDFFSMGTDKNCKGQELYCTNFWKIYFWQDIKHLISCTSFTLLLFLTTSWRTGCKSFTVGKNSKNLYLTASFHVKQKQSFSPHTQVDAEDKNTTWLNIRIFW